MFPNWCLAILLCFSASELRLVARVAPIAWQQNDPTPTSPGTPQSDSQKQLPSDNPAAKAPGKPKKVITNDDLQGSGSHFGFSSGEFSEVNDCDKSCFDYLRQWGRIDPADNPHWRRDVLRAIGLVRKDPEWQKILHELYDIYVKICELGEQEREELSQNADPHNVTRQEVDIEEEYEARSKELQNQLTAVKARQTGLESKANDDPIAYRFRIYQENRISNGACAQRMYRRYPQSYPDP